MVGFLALTFLAASPVSAAALLHYWNFNDADLFLNPSFTIPTAPATLQVSPASSVDVVSSWDTSRGFAGANAVGSDGAGSHLAINNSSLYTLRLNLPTPPYFSNLRVRYEGRRSSTAEQIHQIGYTLNGTDFLSFSNVVLPIGVPQVVTLDFSGVAGVSNNPAFAIQVKFVQGTGGITGNQRFDNITVHGDLVPIIPQAPVLGIQITEVMSSNLETQLDQEGDSSDWIELMNPEAFPVDLSGYGLSDDPAQPFKWVFPQTILAPGQFLLVFASEKNQRPTPWGALHTNFKISSTGELIVLTAPNGSPADQLLTPALGKDVSYGPLTPTGTTFRYFKPATPGAPNVGPGFDGMVPSPLLTTAPGFYTAPVDVNAALAGVEGATLRYTLNGDEPTEASPVLTGPVTLQSRAGQPNLWASIPTAVDTYSSNPKYSWTAGAGWNNGPIAETFKINTFRVRAFKSGYVPSKSVSGSYLVDPAGAGRYPLPMVSIMADYDSLFGPEKGLFVPPNYNESGIQWERPAHLEFFENSAAGFGMDIGIRINGGSSRNARLKSLRIYARSQYGPEQITYPIFPNHPNNTHERLILRSGSSDWSGVAFRDAFAQSLIKDISDVSIQYHRTAVVFINGEYWGIQQFRDRYDNNYLKMQFGVSDVDMLEWRGEVVVEGNNTHYLNLVSYLSTQDLNAAGRYDWVKSQMDVSNFRDYHITQTFIANTDQPGNQNVLFWRSQTVDPGNPYADGRWRWLLKDTDWGFDYGTVSPPSKNMLIYNTSLTNINSTTLVPNTTVPLNLKSDPGSTLPLRRLLSNLEFRQDFIARFSDLLNTVFSAPYVRSQLGGFRSEVAPSMPEHIARWGFPGSLTEWDGLITKMDTFSEQRPSYMWQHLKDYFFLTGTNRVTVDVAGAGSGKVKVNTITVGPGEPGIPAVAFPWSGIYFSGLPVTVRAVALPGYQFSHWTGDVPPGLETTETLTTTLNGDLSLTAVFTPVALPVLRQYWSFNETNALLQPQVGAGNGFITVTGGVAADVLPSTLQGFDVVNANAQLGEVAGTHLRVNNPLGKEMIVRLPTTGVEDAVVKYETRRSGQGAGTQLIAYTTDGTSWVALPTLAIADANPALVTLDFSGIAETDNNANFALRITFEQGAGGTAGNNRFDNLTVNARTLPGFGAAGFPVLTAVPLQTVNEQTGLSLNLAGTDPDAAPDTLTYALVSGPAGLTVSGAGLVEWTPGETLGGTTQPVVVRVRDNSAAGLSSLGRFNISVLEANAAPVLVGVANQTVDELSELSLSLSATDTDLPAQTLTYSRVSGPEGLSVSSAGAVAWTPTEAQGPGSYPVVVRVTDNGSPPASAETGFSITVNEVVGNTPPQLAAIGSQAVDETIALALSLSATDIDVPAQTLTYSLVSGPEGLSVSSSGLVAWTPTGEQGPNSYLVRVRVSDDGDPIQSAEREFSITVRELSTTPVLRQYWSFNETNALLQPRLAAGNAVIEVSGGAAVDVLPSTGQGFEAVNANAQLGDLAGTHLRVNNPIGKTNLIRLPTTGVADAVVRYETRRSGSGAGTQVIEYTTDGTSWVPLQTLAIADANPALVTLDFSSIPETDNNANFALRITFEQGAGGIVGNNRFDNLTLHGVLLPGFGAAEFPVLTAVPATTVNEQAVLNLGLSGTDADVPVQTLSYTLVSGPAGLTISGAGQVEWTPGETQGGSNLPVVVRVSDNSGALLSSLGRFDVSVLEVNVAPVLAGVGNQTMDELSALSLSLSATDTDLPAQTLTYSLVNGPDGLTVSAGGAVAWTPTEAQGPGNYPVVVRVTDSGSPTASVETGFSVAVAEVNAAPVLAGVANQTVDELSALSLSLSATDTDLPTQTLTYSLVNGPAGLTVSAGGAVAWTPTEAQGQGSYPVVVRVTDSGSPTASVETGFSIAVAEVNATPVLAGVVNQTVDELSALSLNLSATDTDLPAQTLTYSLVNGPDGLTVSAGGAVAWTPTEAQGPGNYPVVVRVTDSGSPTASAETSFSVAVNEVADPISRTVWQIGTDNSPTVLPYKPAAEFSQENNRNDLRPGRVTRLAGDPEYVALTNPTTDDDFYFAGGYPAGFNGLTSPLSVPNDEPPVAWERAHTANDRTNRLHFVLAAGQVADQSTFQLSFELVSGGSLMGGVVQPGFADHDIVVNFRNAAGATTQLLAQRVSQTTNLVIPFVASTVGAMAGANTIEIVRTGPAVAGVSYWIQYDYLRLESRPVGNTPPTLATPSDRVVDELVPLSFALSATDTDVPAQTLTYSRVSGPQGLSVSPTGLVTWTPTEAQGPGTYTVEVRVMDNGFPTRSDTRQFTVQVNEVADPVARTVWQIGINDNPAVLPYKATGEFSPENSRNDLPPGKVTRLTGDPQYVAATNPTADDDFYFAGTYPTGFNGLVSVLSVPNDEPFSAWERSQTGNDRTNRMHFTLAPAQVASGSTYRFSFELVFGGSSIGGVVQPGFGEHDMVVRFRNSAGVTSPLFTQRVTQTTNVVLQFTAAAVGAMVGPNSIEIVRTGPVVSGTSYWINNDYFLLENLSNGPAPTGGLALARVGSSPLESNSDGNASAVALAAPGILRLGLVSTEGREYLTLTFDQAEPLPSGTRYLVESTTDLTHWEEAATVVLSTQSSGILRTTTLQDTVPMDSSDRRFLRVRLLPGSGTSGE